MLMLISVLVKHLVKDLMYIDGDLVIVTTNASNNTGGKISAREVVLTDPITGSQATLNYATSGGVSRARVFFTNM